MQFLLTDQEAVDAIRNGVRRDDGLLLIDLPASRLRETSERRPILTFLSDSQTVRWGKKSARLSPTEFALLRHVYECGRTSFEDGQDAIWGHAVSDVLIRNTCSRLSSRLLNAEIPYAVLTRHGSIILEEATL
jgi:hypothetical protein